MNHDVLGTAVHTVRASGSRLARGFGRCWAKTLRVVPPGWDALQSELDLWSKHDRKVPFWWRDDDVSTTSPALDRLLDLRASFGVPIAFAAIPGRIDSSLQRRLSREDRARLLQHGWDHVNRARPGRAKAELCASRQPADVHAELAEGRRRLTSFFGDRFLPVLVPPFGYLAPRLTKVVKHVGYRFISVASDFPGLPLPSRNVHLDVVNWRTGRAAEPVEVVRATIAALKLRRFGIVSAEMPIGIMTHHLDHDSAAWSLVEELLERLIDHSTVLFPEVENIFNS
jgi:peptidoglycan/xylan/chitin deacetylase (PgdA/CDA1 family)